MFSMRNSSLKLPWLLLRLGTIAALFYYIFFGFDLEVFFQHLSSIAWRPTMIVVFIGLLADAVIAARWLVLSRVKCSFKAAFEAFMVSQFFNNLLPAKIGELTRVVYLKTFYGTKITSSLSVLFVERAFDVALLSALALVVANFFVGIPNLELIALSVIVGLSGALLVLRTRRRFLMGLIQLLPSRSFRILTRKTVHEMHKILGLRKVLQMIFITLALWLLYFTVTAAFLAFAADINLTLAEYFVVFVVSSVAMSIPLAPAGTGTYHAGLMFALGLYGVGKEEALATAFVLHLVQVAPPMLVAVLVFWSKNLELMSLRRSFGLSGRAGSLPRHP